MTTSHPIDVEKLLADQLAAASPDLLRSLLSTFIAALMIAEATRCVAPGTANAARRGPIGATATAPRFRDPRRHHRHGHSEAAVGRLLPDWLLTRRKRAERALTSVVATCYLLGVSTRRMERLVESLGVTSFSKSQVSEMAKELDEQVEALRTRPLDAGPYTFVAADALVLKVRENGRVVHRRLRHLSRPCRDHPLRRRRVSRTARRMVESRRYLGLDVLNRSQATLSSTTEQQPATTPALTA
jgi:putative transposase